jgi:serine/threonine protein kinase
MTSPTSIDTAYWRRIDELLAAALALPASERDAWLDSLAPEDARHRDVLSSMLDRSSVETDTFMGAPVDAATLQAASENLHVDRPGDVVGAYRLISQMGAGGMATVWSAERDDGSLQRVVALKLPRSGWSPGLAERLKRECEILSALEHPNIARLYDAGLTEAGRPYLAMELIDGIPIDEYCRAHSLTVRARLRLFLQVASAVTFAHARLIVHRDLKPSNILVDRGGGVHLVDFGLGKLLQEGPVENAAQRTHLTQLTGAALTPAYASPEQIRGGSITVATDVYSLGIVLYELLAGMRPYRLKRDTPAALEEAIMEADVPPASSLTPDASVRRQLRGDLDIILAKALKKNAAERYATVEAFATDIDRHLRALPVIARPDSVAYVVGKFVRRHRGIVAACVLIGTAIVAGAGATLYQARVAARETLRAQAERDRARRELRFAEASEDFMRFLLSEQSARPLPPLDLLARAERAVVDQYAGDAQLRARMQLILADLYGELSQYGRAEMVLAAARKSAEAAQDRQMIAYADCTIGALYGQLDKAAEGLAMLDRTIARLEDSNGDAKVLHNCYSQRATLNQNLGKADDSARDAKAAIALLGPPQPGQALKRATLLMHTAYPLVRSGQLAEGVSIYAVMADDLWRQGQGTTSAGLIHMYNYFSLLVHAGQLRRANELHDRITQAVGSVDSSGSSTLAINYANMLVRSGRAPEAEAIARDAARAKRELGDKRGAVNADLVAAEAACVKGDLQRCAMLLKEVDEAMRPALPPAHPSLAVIDTIKVRLALARGDDKTALEVAEALVARVGNGRTPHAVRAHAVLALARQAGGDLDGARASAARAVEIARDASKGFKSADWVATALLAQAAVHRAQGDSEGWLAMDLEAREQLADSLPPQPAAK